MQLTKTERRILSIERNKTAARKAVAAGYEPHKPGDVIQMSNRSYVVSKDGSFHRVDFLKAHLDSPNQHEQLKAADTILLAQRKEAA